MAKVHAVAHTNAAGVPAPPFTWRSPYTADVPLEVIEETVVTGLGPAHRRRLVLAAGVTLPRSRAMLLSTDTSPLSNEGRPELLAEAPCTIHFAMHQFHLAPVIYGEYESPDGPVSFLYWQHFGSLGAITDVAEELPCNPPLVGATERGEESPTAPRRLEAGEPLGYRGIPVASDFTPREACTLSDGWLLTLPGAPADPRDRADRFLQMVDALLPHIRPAGRPVDDLEELADRSLQWIEQVGHWKFIGGRPYLLAYIGAATTNDVEYMTLMEILEPLLRFQQKTGKHYPLTDRLVAALPSFFSNELRTCVSNFPFEDTDAQADSWYFTMGLAKLADLAGNGVGVAGQMLFESLDYAITMAHKLGYRYPVFFRWSDMADLGGDGEKEREPDAVCGYLYAMVRAWELFDQPRCLEEAKEAARHLGEMEFYGTYELHMNAVGLAGLARLANATGDDGYLRRSLQLLGYLMAYTTYFQADWGFRDAMPTFMALSAMDYLYPAPMEQHQAAHYVAEWLELGGDRLPDYARRLAETFVQYSGGVVRHMYPDALPHGGLLRWSPEFGHQNDPAAPIPVEDYSWDRTPCGTMAQEFYGAGSAPDMAMLARRYGARRSTTGRPCAYVWPRGLSLLPGETGQLEIRCGADEVRAELEVPEAVTVDVSRDGDRHVLRVTPPADMAPGDYPMVCWIGESGHWHPQCVQLHLEREHMFWHDDHLRDPEVWVARLQEGQLEVVEDGLKLTVAEGQHGAVVLLPDLMLPEYVGELVVTVTDCGSECNWAVKLTGDWNGDGRWPGRYDDWPTPLQCEPTTLHCALPEWIAMSGGKPLRLLQLAVQGEPGSYAVFSHLEFLNK